MHRYFRFTVFIGFFVLLFALGSRLPHAAGTSVVEATIFTKRGELPLRLETAVTPAERAHGLMARTSLKPHDGMLFIFPTEGDHWFWMKETLIPLDMLFIDAKQTIVHIAANTKPHSLKELGASQPVLSVIELDGGRAAREGIAVGDNVRYELPTTLHIR